MFEISWLYNGRIILCAVHSLYRMGMIKHRHDGRYEIPEW